MRDGFWATPQESSETKENKEKTRMPPFKRGNQSSRRKRNNGIENQNNPQQTLEKFEVTSIQDIEVNKDAEVRNNPSSTATVIPETQLDGNEEQEDDFLFHRQGALNNNDWGQAEKTSDWGA